MNIKRLIIGTLVVLAMASCDKKSDSARSETKTSEKSLSPVPATTVKASGTVNQVAEDVPMSRANAVSSPTPPK